MFHQYGRGGFAPGDGQIYTFFRLTADFFQRAAAQKLDSAQFMLAYIYNDAHRGFPRDRAKALQLYQLAAAQGHPVALFVVADFHEYGRGVPKDKAKAISFYRRALAAGYSNAADALKRLRA